MPKVALVFVFCVLAGCSQLGRGPSPLPADPGSGEASASAGYNTVYRFKGTPDAGNVELGLFAVDGLLYGTSFSGGNYGGGTVFEVNRYGNERVLYSFQGGTDGLNAYTTLIELNGMFYGVTASGGGTPCAYHYYSSGCGTVFEVSPSGAERVLYRFKGGTDGAVPQVALLAVNGELYGTAQFGGSSNCSGGCGMVFKVTTSGKEIVLHKFDRADGANPVAS